MEKFKLKFQSSKCTRARKSLKFLVQIWKVQRKISKFKLRRYDERFAKLTFQPIWTRFDLAMRPAPLNSMFTCKSWNHGLAIDRYYCAGKSLLTPFSMEHRLRSGKNVRWIAHVCQMWHEPFNQETCGTSRNITGLYLQFTNLESKSYWSFLVVQLFEKLKCSFELWCWTTSFVT